MTPGPPAGGERMRGASTEEPGRAGSGFRQVGEEVVHEGHLLRFAVGTYEGPDGSTFRRDVVRHPGAVAVVAVDDHAVATLVRQYRAPVDDLVLEIVAGTMDQGGEGPEATGRRELAEEAGLAATTWRLLARFHPVPGYCDEVLWCFLATGLSAVEMHRDGGEEEHMTIEHLALAEVPAAIADGRLVDAKTITGLLLAREALAAPPPAAGSLQP